MLSPWRICKVNPRDLVGKVRSGEFGAKIRHLFASFGFRRDGPSPSREYLALVWQLLQFAAAGRSAYFERLARFNQIVEEFLASV